MNYAIRKLLIMPRKSESQEKINIKKLNKLFILPFIRWKDN